MRQICLMKLLVVTLSFGLNGASEACSYDGQFSNPFIESYPGSLDIAIATQAAVVSERINKVGKLEGNKGLRRASWWLMLMAKQQPSELKSVSYIYLIDSQLWSKVSQDGQIEVHTAPTAEHTISVLLLSEAALNAVISRQLPLDRAIEMGIASISQSRS